ncbi:hypothetical protein MAPG_07352 [Magnaporthiopsis poae ATCC 64411]|uniref:Telomeric single stranded DNA binding POT1/Cdc13 domain-containing protein n=1 Tax=Magnaporthiopsis poae (strain ATCC 64411 / 73-15) TaxID=644358 RepID=A0A0C4E4F9_MAGP6|nr:hypothetical protein MAPG_07352 [Magnaporthiopsis poae ATCC 64411]
MDDPPAGTALAARLATPISELCPDLSEQQSRVVRGEVTICWPLNSVRQSFAFVIAEPDVRLRASHGQIRIQIDGPNAKAVAQSGIFSGDEVLLALDGAEWADNSYQDTRIPGSSSLWELRYPKRIHLEFTSDSGETKTLDLDDIQSADASNAADFEVPNIDLHVPDAPDEPDTPDVAAVSGPVRPAEPDEYASPAFIKRARLSYGSLLDADNDWLEEDGWVKGKGRKKARFGRYSNAWRYASRSPSPGSSDDDAGTSAPAATANNAPHIAQPLDKPAMADDGCQVVEADLTPVKARDNLGTAPSPPLEQLSPSTEAHLPGTPQNPVEIDDDPADDDPVRNVQDDGLSQPSASSNDDDPTRMHITFAAARGFAAPSLGDYSSPRFAANIPGTSLAYEGPSLEEQVRFGFHHSPASDHLVTGPGATNPVFFPKASTATASVDSQQPQTMPLWHLRSSRVMDRDHVDAELNIDPALVAAEAPGTNIDDQPVTLARSESVGTSDSSYNRRRFQNEGEDGMAVDAEADGVKSPSDSYSNADEAEYERELANEAGDDYDMRAYVDVDDDVDDDEANQEQAGGDDAEIFEGGGSYCSDDEDRSDQEDEEGLYDEDRDSESDGEMASSPMRRAPARPPQETGPIVIDLLSDSSDDEDGEAESPVPPVSTSLRRSQRPAQDSPPSPSYEVHPDDPKNEEFEDSEGYEGSEDYGAADASDIDASGESEEELDGFESPAQAQTARSTRRADAIHGDDVSNAEVSDDDDQAGDEMQEETADIAESPMETPTSPVVAARSDQSDDSVGGDEVDDTTVAQPVDDKSRKSSPAGDAEASLMSEAPLQSPVDEIDMEGVTANHASKSEMDSPNRVVSLEQGVDSPVRSKDSTGRSSPARAIGVKDEAEPTEEVNLLVAPSPRTQTMDPQDPEEHHPVEETTHSPAAEDTPPRKALDNDTVGQLPTPLETQIETVMETQAAEDSMMQVDTQPSSNDDVEPSRETQVASSLEVADAAATITVVEDVEVVELVGDDSNNEDSRSAVSADEERGDEEMADAEAPEQESADDEMADVRGDGSSLHSDELEVAMEDASAIDSVAAFPTQEVISTQEEDPFSPSNASDDGSDVSDMSDDEGPLGAKAALGAPTKAEQSNVSGSQPHTAPDSSFQEPPLDISVPAETPRDAASSQGSANDTQAYDSVRLEVVNDPSSDSEQSAPSPPVQDPSPMSSPAAETGRGQLATQFHGGFATRAPCSGDEYVNDDILTQPQNTQPSAASKPPDAGAPADGPVPAHQHQPPRFASQEPPSDNEQKTDEDAQSDKGASAPEDVDESEDDESTGAAELDPAMNYGHDSAGLDVKIDDLQESGRTKTTPPRPKDFKIDIRDEYHSNDALPSPAQEEPQGRSGSRGAEMEAAAASSPEPIRASPGNVSDAITVRTDEETPTRKIPRKTKTNLAVPATSDPSIKLARAAASVRKAMPVAEIHDGPEISCLPTTPAASLAATSPWSAQSSPNITGLSGFQPYVSEYGETGRVIDRSTLGTPEQISKLRTLDLITSILGPDWGGTGGTPPTTITPRATNEVKKIAEAAQQLLPAAVFEYFRVHLWTIPPDNGLDELQGFFVRSFPDGTFPERKAVNAAKEIRRIIKSRSNLKPRSETPQKVQDPSLKLAKAVLNSPSRNLRASNPGDGDADAASEATATTITSLKLEIGRFFRGNMADYTTLISLRSHPGKQVNVVGVVTAASKQPVRTKARQYAMSISITDHTISPTNVVEVQFYRLHQEALPVTKPGDRVLLRNFTVIGLTGRGHGLRSNDASEYAVFDDKHEEAGGNSSSHEHEDKDDKDEAGSSSSTHPMAQIRGGPVELEDYEYEIATLLKNWYKLLPIASKDKLEKANRKLAAAGAAISVES